MNALFKPSLALFVLLFSASANAALMISVSDGTQTATFSDTDNNGIVGFDSDFMPGVWASTNWPSVSVKGFGSSWYTSQYADLLHLNSIDGSSSTGGTLTVMLSETDLTSSIAPFLGDFGGVSGGDIQFQTYIDASNTIFGLETLLHDTSIASAGAFSGTFGGEIDLGSTPYSKTIIATIQHSNRAVSSFDYEIVVPEPGSLALIGIGFLFAGLATQRRRSKQCS